MILFTPEMAEAILAGRKTVTRRRGKRRWNVGSIHLAYTRPAFARPPGKPFARLRITDVTHEVKPGDWYMVKPNYLAEAQREGFYHWNMFTRAYAAMNGEDALREPCWRVEFALCDPAPTSLCAEHGGHHES